MAIFSIQVMDKNQCVVEETTLEMGVETAEQAMMDMRVIKLKKEAKAQGMGFRVRRL